MKAREVVLARRPPGRPDASCFDITDRPVPDLPAGSLLMRSAAISVDPSMIPRLQVATYAPAFPLGAVIEARAVGQVVRSADDGWAEGDWAVYWGGWRDLAVVPAGSALRIYPTDSVPPHTWLHVLGVPGLTAYVGLTQVARVQPGETVWVSAATGAVGSVAAQLAKARGAGLVIGSTGGPAKARYLTQTLGLDAAVDYRAGDLRSQLRQAAPDGIHVYFDNVGGDHLEAALDVMQTGGRIAVCGMISGYGVRQAGPPNIAEIIIKRLRVEGFLVLDHLDRRAEFEAEVVPLLEEGTLHTDVTFFEGIDSAPAALLSLLDGTKLGKALIQP
jgi:NADPH-dependent curcumin reductase CurA